MSVGQHFILGFRGPELPQWVEVFAGRHTLGGIILFDYDLKTKSYKNNILSKAQLSELCASIHALPGEPLVFIDQEGGKVRRLKENLGFQPLPSHEALAKIPVTERKAILAESFREMTSLGIDVDLAPVVDANYFPENPDIGAIGRSFSADPQRIEKNASLFFEAAEAAGLLLCLKHYPGLGGATVNSHEALTDITESIHPEQLDLFYSLGKKLPGHAILVSHGLVKTWDDQFPVSVSLPTLQKLRQKLPEAVLISDDLQMQGLQKLLTSEQATIQGLSAGLDFVLLGNNLIDQQLECFNFAEAVAKRAAIDSPFASILSASRRRIQQFKSLKKKRVS